MSNIEKMAQELNAEFEGIQNKDEKLEDYKNITADYCDKMKEEAKGDHDPVLMFFKLKRTIWHDVDLFSLSYEPEIIPLIHKNLEKIVSPDLFNVINKVYKVFRFNVTEDRIKLIQWYWENILQGVFEIEQLHEKLSKFFIVDYEYRIVGMPTTKSDIEYSINNRGIKKITTTYPENPQAQPIIRESEIWNWNDFRILQVLKSIGETETLYRYNFIINGDLFQDKNLVEMRDHIYDNFCKSAGKDKQVFGPLVNKYVIEAKIPIMQYSSICGFTRDNGWKLPDKYFIQFTPVQAKIKNCIYQTCKMKFTEPEAKAMMKMLYEATSLRYKDVLFAHMAVMPFLYALRDYTDLLYWLALGSPMGNTGKTPAGVMITHKIWNNLPRPFITKDQASSESRLGDYISSSTFGIVIDDCGDLPDEVVNTIKSYITGEAGFTRKNTDQTARIDKDFTDPLIFTMNKNFSLFDDTAFLSRGMYVPVNEVPTPEQVQKFKVAWKEIPRGYIGRYIYEKTKEADIEYFQNIYDFTEDWKGAPMPRSNVIYKLLQVGKYLFDQWFDIKLDLSEVPSLINKTLGMGSDDIFTIAIAQMEDARVEEDYVFDQTIDQDETGQKQTFSPKRRWITAPLFHKASRKFTGFIYTSDNLQDMINRLRIKNGLDLPALTEIFRKRWHNVEYITVKVKEKSLKGIYIPDLDIDEEAEAEEQENKKIESEGFTVNRETLDAFKM